MKAKFVNEARYAMRKIDIDPELQAEFGIPDWALLWNGVDVPEAGEYVDERLEPGYVTANFQGEPMVVIYKDKDGTIATHAHNVSEHDYYEKGIDESVYTSGELSDNEYLDELFAEKDDLLDAMETAQEMGYSSENIRLIAQELAVVEEKIKAEELEMSELREM